jgi:hypothetical protein
MSEHKLPKKEMPLFVFMRQPDIELEAGFILAGRLVVDRDMEELLPDIVAQLLKEAARSGAETNTMTVGWKGDGGRPPNAVDINDDMVTAAWRKNFCLTVEVRVDPRNDGMVRFDSDIMRQLKTKA